MASVRLWTHWVGVTAVTVVFPETSVCEGTNKRKHGAIGKKAKCIETDSDEEEEDKECQYLTKRIRPSRTL